MANQITTPSGLKYEDIEPGTGPTAQSGQKAKVHYTGWLKNGPEIRLVPGPKRPIRVHARGREWSLKDGTKGSPG